MNAWKLRRGAMVLPGGRAHFEVWAPLAQRLALHLPKTRRLFPMDGPSESGVFALEADNIEPGTDYAYRLNGEPPEVPDPVSRYQPEGVFGQSRVVDPACFAWNDRHWRGLEMADLMLYELHVGTFTHAGTFDAVIERLSHLRELGITAIEVMPVAQFPGSRNWGYDGVFPYAVQSTYGGPEGLRRLVNAAHSAELAVILDVVYNHLGPEGNVLPRYGPYFTDKYKTPWGQAINFDGSDSDEVRRYVIDNALHWLSEYHIDGLRLDAVHAICDFSATNILEEIATEALKLQEQLGRRLLIIAESDLNDARLVRPRERGGFELDAAWSDDLHHAVHAALTGEQSGYYQDFKDTAAIARAVQQRYVYGGEYSTFRRRRHGAPATDVPADRFVVFAQNHDQVGNRAQGDRLSNLLSFERQKLAAAMALLSPYVPLLFMGEEYGETNPFLYFVSLYSPELIDAVRQGRSEEFESFAWQGGVPGPAAESTFEASKLDWSRMQDEPHAEMLAMYRQLLALRKSEPALRPGEAQIEAQSSEHPASVQWRLRHPSGRDLQAFFNLSRETAECALGGEGGAWRCIFCTASKSIVANSLYTGAAKGAVRLMVTAETGILLRQE